MGLRQYFGVSCSQLGSYFIGGIGIKSIYRRIRDRTAAPIDNLVLESAAFQDRIKAVTQTIDLSGIRFEGWNGAGSQNAQKQDLLFVLDQTGTWGVKRENGGSFQDSDMFLAFWYELYDDRTWYATIASAPLGFQKGGRAWFRREMLAYPHDYYPTKKKKGPYTFKDDPNRLNTIPDILPPV